MTPFEIIVNIVFAVIFMIYWGMVFVILYHLTRFGIGTLPKRLSVVFLFGALVFSGAAVILFTTIDLNSLIPK
jgi:hypothetical protein